MRNALTIDVEDYFHVSGFAGQIPPGQWDRHAPRVERNTYRLLELLETHEVRATFFVLGWVADRFPQLVRDIHQAGHEVGSHSWGHQLIYRLTPSALRDDLRRARDQLQELIAQPVVSYRAPSFSITERSRWALEILVEEGFQFDSSIFPVRHDRYGMPGAPRQIHPIDTPAGRLWEFPLAVARVAGCSVPVGGGGYFRLYPYALTRRWLRAINGRSNRPFVFYIHPWEIDPDQPRLASAPRLARLRHYVNLSTTEGKLRRLLHDFEFAPLADVMRAIATDAPVCTPAA